MKIVKIGNKLINLEHVTYIFRNYNDSSEFDKDNCGLVWSKEHYLNFVLSNKETIRIKIEDKHMEIEDQFWEFVKENSINVD